MQHPDEGTIHAWLDGELSADKADELMAHMSDCLKCAALVAETRGLVAASTRILTALDDVSGGVIPASPTDPLALARPRRWYDRTDLRAAAAVLFVAGASLLLARGGRDSADSRAMLAVADQVPSAGAVANTAGAEGGKLLNEPRTSSPPETQLRKTDLEASSDKANSATPAATARTRADAPAAPESRALDVAPMQNQPTSTLSTSGALATPAGKATDSALTLGNAVRSLDEMHVSGVAEVRSTVPLRVVGVDSSAFTTRTVYEVSPGVEVTLAESSIGTAKNDFNIPQQMKREAVSPQRSAEAPRAKTVTAAAGRVLGVEKGPATAAAKAVPPAMATVAPAPLPLNVISWSERGRRYTLAGRLTIQQLETLKARLMQMRR